MKNDRLTTENTTENTPQAQSGTATLERENAHRDNANGAATMATQNRSGEAVSGAINRLFSPQSFSPAAFLSNPFEAMRRIQGDMDRVFESLAATRGNGALDNSGNWGWAPKIEAFERENELVVRAELPGLKRDDVKLQVDDGILMLSGERKAQNRSQDQGFYHCEMSYGRFQRAFRLPETAQVENIKARFEDGILEITIPNPQLQRKAHDVTID